MTETIDNAAIEFPPGSRIRHRKTGEIYVMGVEVKARGACGEFWIMRLDPPERKQVRAEILIKQFELPPQLTLGGAA